MAFFDKELWEFRAQKRHARGVGSSPPTGGLTIEMKAISGLSTLIAWCTERGTNVEFVRLPRHMGAVYDSEQNYVKVSSRALPEKQLCILLHECGHMLIGNRRQHERYGMGHHQKDPDVRRTLHHRFDVLDEEMEAWFRGMKLARRLKIKLDKETFHSTRLSFLKDYVKWVLEPGNFDKASD